MKSEDISIPRTSLRILLLQMDIAWGDKKKNIAYIEDQIKKQGKDADLIVLPEMCTTGFCTRSLLYAETDEEETIQSFKQIAYSYGVALAGSFMQKDSNADVFHNRAFLITPTGEYFYSDKRHLFRMGAEHELFSPAQTLTICAYKGWNIALFVCYDLRFPVWSRNVNSKYDLAIYVANWPASRIHVWDTLLAARAIENQAYVCGVNRVGQDAELISYNGHSALFSPYGKPLLQLTSPTDLSGSASIDLESLQKFRQKFPVWKDADSFIFQDK